MSTVLFLQILHVSGQVDIMRQAIMEVNSNNELSTPLTVLSNLIHRHRNIITLSNDIENLFSSIALLQLLWNTLITCCSGFMIIIVSEINCFGLLNDNLPSFAGSQYQERRNGFNKIDISLYCKNIRSLRILLRRGILKLQGE